MGRAGRWLRVKAGVDAGRGIAVAACWPWFKPGHAELLDNSALGVVQFFEESQVVPNHRALRKELAKPAMHVRGTIAVGGISIAKALRILLEVEKHRRQKFARERSAAFLALEPGRSATRID